MWLTQVGDASQFRNFAAFRAAVLAHPVQVAARPAVGALAGGFDVSYESPTEGAVSFGTTGPLRVKGADVALDTGKRYDNPWALRQLRRLGHHDRRHGRRAEARFRPRHPGDLGHRPITVQKPPARRIQQRERGERLRILGAGRGAGLPDRASG